MLDSPNRQPIEIETWPIDRPRAYERNARTHSPEQIAQLRHSFRAHGQVWPLLVREDGTIIAGHGRIEAAKAEGFTTVQVIVARGWSEQQCRSFALLDNRVPLNAGWDEDMLRIEIGDLKGLGIDLGALGFGTRELDLLLGPIDGAGDPDDVPPVPDVAVTIAGDVWTLGDHRLICGDATVPGDVRTLLGDIKPLLMVTDPPYGVEYDPEWRARAGINKNRAKMGQVRNDDRADWREAWALFGGDVAYVWHGALHTAEVAASLEAAQLDVRAQIIWAKDRLVMGRGDYHWQHEPCWYVVRSGSVGHWNGDRTQTTVWNIRSREDSGHGHGTQKPVECMRRPIENNSQRGDVIYDPFCGSGTTIIAAEMSGRNCYGIDIDPRYVDVAIERWQQFTKGVAVLAPTGETFAQVKAQRAVAAT